jgi:hypothetical protein
MSNKKNAPDVLRDGANIVGGSDKRKVIESPPDMIVRDPNSIPGRDESIHSHLEGPGKKRFPLPSKSGW